MSEVFSHQKDAVFLSKLILTLPALVIAIVAPFAGILADKLGRKKLLIISLLLYGASGTNGLYVNDLYWILAGRVMLGFAVAGIMTASTTLIADYFEGNARDKFLGIQSMFMALGAVLYVGIGGFLADFHWRAPFGLYGVSILLIPLAYSVLIEPEKHNPIQAPNPEGRKVNRRRVSFIYLSAIVSMIAFYMVPVQIPFYLMEKFDVNSSRVGISIAAATISAAIAAAMYPKLKSKFSFEFIMVISLFFLAMGYGVISFVRTYEGILIGLFIGGQGLGLVMPNLNLWIMQTAHPAFRGRLLGGLASAFFAGQFLSPIITEPIVNHFSLRDAFWFVSIALVVLSISLLIYLLIRNKKLVDDLR